jgi:hypothetical protein
MAPRRTKEEIKSLLSEAKPQFQQMARQYNDQDAKWQNEITMLERRVYSEYEDIDLGNGDRIAIRTALSEAESRHIGDLNEERETLDKKADTARLNEIAYEILEIMTANPFLTRDWFENNRDKFALTDVLQISIAFYEQVVQRSGRRQAVGKFRENE